MMPPEKSNIRFGDSRLDVKSPKNDKLMLAPNSSEKKKRINIYQTNIDIKTNSSEIKSGLYQ
jgi:hypothetical protein